MIDKLVAAEQVPKLPVQATKLQKQKSKKNMRRNVILIIIVSIQQLDLDNRRISSLNFSANIPS